MPPRDPLTSLLFLPGLACDAAVFAPQVQALSVVYRTHVSDAHTRGDTLVQMAALLWAEQPGKHVLIGCSMGGMLALEMHRQQPLRVRAIALLGTSARADTPELIALRTEACERFATGRMEEVLRANLLFAFDQRRPVAADVVDAYLAMVRRAGPAQLIRQNRAVMARIDSRPHLPDIQVPVLVACGEADLLTPPALSQEIADLLRDHGPARLASVADAGHMLTMEQPHAVTALLTDWLADWLASLDA